MRLLAGGPVPPRMNTALVSICVPTYNRPEYLRRAVESCLAQTYPHLEVIITDNSTNEESARMAAKWSDPRARYFSNQGNVGAVASSNRAVSLSQGQYIKFLMDDDLLKPRCLEWMVKAMEENPTAGIVMAPMELIDAEDRRIFPKFYVFRKMHYRYRYQVGDGLIDRRRILKDFLTRDYPCTVPSGLMFRAEALRRAGPFRAEADFAGDLEMCMRIAPEWDFYYIDEVLSSWRFMPVCHTASLHQTGLKISVFYDITRQCLDNPHVREFFQDNWKKIVRDSVFFCSCRALLNGLAGLRARDTALIFSTIKTILREDSSPVNWLRLPLFVIRQIWISIFPRQLPPPRG
jgi:glycosyltransferase involved in cell wall biosynthesis